MLYDIKQRVIQRKNDFEYKSQVYTAKMLIEDCVVDLDGRSNVYKDIMYRLIDERRLSMNSRKRYEYSYRKICEYLGRDGFIVDELNLGFVKDFSSWLGKSVCDGTIKDLLACVAAVWNYAIDRRIVSDELFPFREFKFTTRFKRGERDYFLDVSHIKLLMDYWLDLVIERDGNRWHYKDGAYDLLRKRTSKEWGILWFLLCYKLNGSAPVDVALLKLSECKNIEINGERYWAIDFKRQKTKRDVHVRWKRDMFSIIALEHFMGDSCNGYVYRVIDMDDEYKKLKQSSRNAEVALKWVRKAFEEINGKIIQSNVDNGVREPLIEVQRVDMYTARHSFANHFINSPNATIGGLASLMARSPNTIATYVHQLTKDEEIASLVESMVI
jgi:site-specific recombinase XerD